jgi:hypothetical protein
MRLLELPPRIMRAAAFADASRPVQGGRRREANVRATRIPGIRRERSSSDHSVYVASGRLCRLSARLLRTGILVAAVAFALRRFVLRELVPVLASPSR